MQVEIRTVYTEEALLKAIRFSMDKKKRMGIYLGICTILVALSFLLVFLMGEVDSTMWICLGSIIFLDLLSLFMYVVYPRMMVKKAKNKNLSITFTFTDENIGISAKNEYMEENSSMKYSVMAKVHKQGNDLFIFDTMKHVYFIDLSEAEGKDVVILKELIERNFDKKKIIWE